MANPNLSVASNLYGDTAAVGIGTTDNIGIVTNTSSSGEVYKINTIIVANKNGSNSSDINVSIYDGSNDIYLANLINVPPKASQIIITKETYFYLKEGQQVRVQASTADILDVVVGFEVMS